MIFSKACGAHNDRDAQFSCLFCMSDAGVRGSEINNDMRGIGKKVIKSGADHNTTFTNVVEQACV